MWHFLGTHWKCKRKILFKENFQFAGRQHYLLTDGVVGIAIIGIYVHTRYQLYRYQLSRVWQYAYLLFGHLLSNINTAAEIPIKNIKLIVNISTVIWCPRLHKPSLATRCGPPIPFTTVKCVELAIDIVSKSLVLIWFESIPSGMIVSSLIRCIIPFGNRVDASIEFNVMFALYSRCCCCEW